MKRPVESFIKLVGAFFVPTLLAMIGFPLPDAAASPTQSKNISPQSAQLRDQAEVKDGTDVMASLNARWAVLTRDHLTFETDHFIVRYPPGKDALLMPLAVETLERSREAMAKFLGWTPPERVVVEFYPNGRALSEATTLPLKAIETTGTVAVSKFNKIMAVSPKALVHGYSWRETLAHEYVHLAVTELSQDTVPVWVHEGLAKFFESAWRTHPGDGGLSPASAAFLIHEAKRQALIPFEKMSPSLALLPTPEDALLAYAEAFTVVEYLVAKAGPKAPEALVRAYGAGNDDSDAFRAAAGEPFKAFVAGWKSDLKKRTAPMEAHVIDSERRRFAREDNDQITHEAKAQDKLQLSDFPELKNQEAKRRAHLGELLRLRGRNEAATVEFQQAYALVGDASPNLSNRYAQALMGAADELEQAAKKTAKDKKASPPKKDESAGANTVANDGESHPDIQAAKAFRALALKILRESRKLFPTQSMTLKLLGNLAAQSNDSETAKALYLEALGIDPFDPDLHRALKETCGKSPRDEACEAREDLALKVLAGELSAWPTPKTTPPVATP